MMVYSWTGSQLIGELVGLSGLKQGAAGRDRAISARTEPRVRKVTPITDLTSTALGKEEKACRLFGTNSHKEGVM
jgi:hypothetical protein